MRGRRLSPPRCHARLRRAGLRTACARGAQAPTTAFYRGKFTSRLVKPINKGARGGPRAGHSCCARCARCARCAHCASWCFARLRRGVGDAASPLTSEKKSFFSQIRSHSAVAVESRKVCQNKSLKWGAVDTLPHIRTHFGHRCNINGHLW